MKTAVYEPVLGIHETEAAIEDVKQIFARELAEKLELKKVSAPLAVLAGTGINDDLNGVEEPVKFKIKSFSHAAAEVVQSLAKWKRVRLKELEIEEGKGIFTNMSAIRPDEVPSPIHSIFVDQWDWEKRISPKERTVKFLRSTVEKIYDALKSTEMEIGKIYPDLEPFLPEKISFIHSEELAREFPLLTPKEREDKAAEMFGAVFIIGIGGVLSDGKAHDLRAPDYDDWSTGNEEGFYGLNGDIIVWNPVLKKSFELSSMGIRVDSTALYKQLSLTQKLERLNLFFHKQVITESVPLSIGGGIGQSRLCMLFLRKLHIGEVQSSIWPKEIREEMLADGVQLL